MEQKQAQARVKSICTENREEIHIRVDEIIDNFDEYFNNINNVTCNDPVMQSLVYNISRNLSHVKPDHYDTLISFLVTAIGTIITAQQANDEGGYNG